MEQYYYKQRTEKFFKLCADKFDSKVKLNKRDLEFLFAAIVENLELPLPNVELRGYFINIETISELFIQTFNSHYLDPDDRKMFAENFDKVHKLLKIPRSKHFYQFRILGDLGYYPNTDFKRASSEYSIVNFKPTILTRNNYEVESQYGNYSTISWITRNELKFNASLICSIGQGWGFLFFENANSISLDENTVQQLPKSLRNYFLLETLQMLNSLKSPKQSFYSKESTSINQSYDYFKFDEHLKNFELAFDKFSITNHLLLRTSNHLSKAVMLDRNKFYKEEAVTNIFICLEGCLHLLQKKWGDAKPALNLKLLEEKFKAELDDENLFGFIKEAYDKRISLIHPEPKWGSQWTPYIDFHDFFDYFKIRRYLLHYYLTGNLINYW